MITVTDTAAAQVERIKSEMKCPEAALRLAVLGGDCAGLKYHIALDDFRGANDFAVESNGILLYTDSTSAPYLWGSEVEWMEVEDDAGFVILNPNKGRSKGGCSNTGDGEGCMTLGDGKHCVKGEQKCKTCTSSSEPIPISLLD